MSHFLVCSNHVPEQTQDWRQIQTDVCALVQDWEERNRARFSIGIHDRADTRPLSKQDQDPVNSEVVGDAESGCWQLLHDRCGPPQLILDPENSTQWSVTFISSPPA